MVNPGRTRQGGAARCGGYIYECQAEKSTIIFQGGRPARRSLLTLPDLFKKEARKDKRVARKKNWTRIEVARRSAALSDSYFLPNRNLFRFLSVFVPETPPFAGACSNVGAICNFFRSSLFETHRWMWPFPLVCKNCVIYFLKCSATSFSFYSALLIAMTAIYLGRLLFVLFDLTSLTAWIAW